MRPKQGTFAEGGFERHRKVTRREEFLAQMDRVVPWEKLVALIEPFYPAGEGPGRPPIGLERMLRILGRHRLPIRHRQPTPHTGT